MDRDVSGLAKLSKQSLFDAAGEGFLAQTGGELLDAHFALPSIDPTISGPLPSIETFVASTAGEISAMGTNTALNAEWQPVVERLIAAVHAWAAKSEVEFTGDAYVTASITPAADVNGEAHFDDDQFTPTAGAGLVAIVGDLSGPRVAADPVPHDEINSPRPVVASDAIKGAFADGTISSAAYGANELVLLPQFAQLHAGPGPCGSADEVRHLLVFRASTKSMRD